MWSPNPTEREPPATGSSAPDPRERREAILTIPLPPIAHAALAGTSSIGLAEVEGYDLAPDRTITVAASGAGPEATGFLETGWTALRERGLGRLRSVRTDERGRTVAIVSIEPPEGIDLARLLGSVAIVPARMGPTAAEVRVLATDGEMERLAQALEEEGLTPSAVVLSRVEDPTRETGPTPEDWAFLGLLVAIGAFEGRRSLTPTDVAERLEIDPTYFVGRVRTIESAMRNLVVDILPERAPSPSPSVDGAGPT